VAAVAVSMSDGSAFSGTLAASPAGTVTISGKNLVLARALTSADAGSGQWSVAATQNGVTVSGSIPVQVNAASPPPPPPPSPDGSALCGGSTGNLITTAGIWTFGTMVSTGIWAILLNGSQASTGTGNQLVVSNGGQIYLLSDITWLVWTGSSWSASNPNPIPSPCVSPDGTSLCAGAAGQLVISGTGRPGVWTWAGTELFRNGGLPDGNNPVSGQQIVVQNGGQLFLLFPDGVTWGVWNGIGWAGGTPNPIPTPCADPPPPPPPPPPAPPPPPPPPPPAPPPPPGGGSPSLMVNGSTAPAPIVSGDGMWVAVRNGPGSTGALLDFVSIRSSDGTEVSDRYYPGSGVTEADLAVYASLNDVPITAGNYFVDFTLADSYVAASVPITLSAFVQPPFPALAPALNVNNVNTFEIQISPTLVAGQGAPWVSVSGTVAIGGAWVSNGGSPPNNIWMQFFIDGVPLGSPVFVASGGAASVRFDTTTKANGTYMVDAKCLDSADPTWPAYTLWSWPCSMVICNGGSNTSAQLVPTTALGSRFYSSGTDYVNYLGLPEPSASYPYPGPGHTPINVPPVWSGMLTDPPWSANPALARVATGGVYWWENINQLELYEYQHSPQFSTTSAGGVIVTGWLGHNNSGEGVEDSYPIVAANSYLDGGRNSNMCTGLVVFTPTPAGAPFASSAIWTGIQLDGRLLTVDLNGTITTIAGYKRDTSQLPVNWEDPTNPEFPTTITVGTISSDPKYFFSDFGGAANDLCWDPRNPNICYVSQTVDHCIVKIDFTATGSHGPSNPLCQRYAGYKGGLLGDGVGGYADGPALGTVVGGVQQNDGAQFNGVYSICMQRRTDNPTYPQGTMFVADNYNGLIRMISADGTTVSTLVGTHGGTVPVAGADASPFAWSTVIAASVTISVTSLTQNMDGVTAAVVLAGSPASPVTSIGWKMQIFVNGGIYQSGGSTYENSLGVYTVSAFTNSTHFSLAMSPVPSSGTITALITAADKYSSPLQVTFANAYTPYPNTIRMTSGGDIVVGEAWYNMMCRRIWLNNNPNTPSGNWNTITRLLPFGNNAEAQGTSPTAFGSFDIDYSGACGPIDDIVSFKTDSDPGSAANAFRFSLDLSYNSGGSNYSAGNWYGQASSVGPSEGQGGVGHYPWAFAFHDRYCRMISVGLGQTGLNSWRPVMSTDPVLDWDTELFPTGQSLFFHGTASMLPPYLRPSFTSIYGYSGWHLLGQNVLPTIDDIQATYPTDFNPSGGSQAGTLAAFIQAGMGGVVARPEFSIDDNPPAGTLVSDTAVPGRDLQALLYFLRRQSLAGSWPIQALPGPGSLDFIRPQITEVSAVRLSNTSIQVTWSTDKPTIGLIAARSPNSFASTAQFGNGYNMWSPLEATFASGTRTHTISGLVDVTQPGQNPTHFVVFVKDKAGNWNSTADMTLAAPTSSIGSASGRDFPTIEAWMAAIPSTITTDAYPNGVIGQCYADSEFEVTVMLDFQNVDTSAFDGAGIPAITLTTGPGQSFRDNPNVRKNALAYNIANGVGINFNITPTETASGGLITRVSNVTISNLQFKLTNGNWVVYTDDNSALGTIIVENCILDDYAGGTPVFSGTVSVYRNCLILCRGFQDPEFVPHGSVFDGPAGVGGHFYFCTVVSRSDWQGNMPSQPQNAWTSSFGEGGGTTTWENCCFFGFQQASDVVPPGATYVNCMTDDMPETGLTGGVVYANQFYGTTSATADFREKSGANLQSAGTADTTNGATDISGHPRPTGTAWDIGCWQL
jgi:hypothetical protein